MVAVPAAVTVPASLPAGEANLCSCSVSTAIITSRRGRYPPSQVGEEGSVCGGSTVVTEAKLGNEEVYTAYYFGVLIRLSAERPKRGTFWKVDRNQVEEGLYL